jgi:hypothetical protein
MSRTGLLTKIFTTAMVCVTVGGSASLARERTDISIGLPPAEYTVMAMPATPPASKSFFARMLDSTVITGTANPYRSGIEKSTPPKIANKLEDISKLESGGINSALDVIQRIVDNNVDHYRDMFNVKLIEYIKEEQKEKADEEAYRKTQVSSAATGARPEHSGDSKASESNISPAQIAGHVNDVLNHARVNLGNGLDAKLRLDIRKQIAYLSMVSPVFHFNVRIKANNSKDRDPIELNGGNVLINADSTIAVLSTKATAKYSPTNGTISYGLDFSGIDHVLAKFDNSMEMREHSMSQRSLSLHFLTSF